MRVLSCAKPAALNGRQKESPHGCNPLGFQIEGPIPKGTEVYVQMQRKHPDATSQPIRRHQQPWPEDAHQHARIARDIRLGRKTERMNKDFERSLRQAIVAEKQKRTNKPTKLTQLWRLS